GDLLVEGHGEVGVGLVVPVPHVEPGPVLLDHRHFELEGLHLVGGDDPLHPGRLAHHCDGPGMQAEPEVVGDAVAQALGLPDVDDAVGRIPEEVDAAGFWDVCAAGPPGRIVSHRPIVGAVRLAPYALGCSKTGQDPCATRAAWNGLR